VEQAIHFDGPEGPLEGLLSEGKGRRAGVILHPHPMYGGTMHNNVVLACLNGMAQAGLSTLRFNFRGVGKSAGRFADGRGEQDDLIAAVEFFQTRGVQDVVVAGYSFGAWVAAMAWPGLAAMGVEPLILVAPPAAFMSFDSADPSTRVGLMIAGQRDEIGPPALAAAFGARLTPPVVVGVINDADHFFGGFETLLADRIKAYLEG
jgi:alpha/beta superfamily hydrolase